MRSRSLSLVLAATVAAMFVQGCKSDEPTAPPPAGGGTARALIPISYTHIKDSDGGAPNPGNTVTLLFEPESVAQLYVASPTDAIAYRGSYSYAGGRLTLKFNDADFKPDATFPLDTAQETVTLPFKVFSEGAGSSTWKKERLLPQYNFSAIFKAALINEKATVDGAIDRVVGYANAVIEAQGAAKGMVAKTSASSPTLTAVEKMPNGVKVRYDNGPWNYILLYAWPATPNSGALTPGPLASDPRVHLDPVSPHNPSFDPPNKRAVFIAPFDRLKFYSWVDLLRSGAGMSPAEGYNFSGSENFEFNAMESVLEKRGYTVEQILNEDASVMGIITAMTGAQGAPGFVAVNTHAMSDGSITTGTYLGSPQTVGAIALQDFEAYRRERDAINAAGFGDLFTYDGGTPDAPATLAWTAIERDMRPGTYSYFLTITPKFWEWLRLRHGAKFDRSLFYFGCCLTDRTADLRNAIQARAHMAFNVPVRPELAGATFQYLCKSLARHTHSAEESYYNIIRIATTRQMIYAEDNLYNGLASPQGQGQQATLKDIFQGYGFDGGTMVSYQSAGWLKTAGADPGAIWWLLFSGRWGQNAQEGSDGMRSCWQSVWKDGQTGGLGNPGCNSKAPGRAPTETEVAYASYLLNGLPVVGGSGTALLPRWTLNDGGE